MTASPPPSVPRDWPPGAVDLLLPRAPLGLPLPAYEGRSLPNVAASVALALGATPSPASLGPLAPAVDPFHGRRADGPVLLFVVDGFGYGLLRRRASRPDGATAGRWLARTAPLTSVFPTTTTAALTSLATAAPPSRHGVVGYRQFLPRFGSVVDVLRMSPYGVSTPETLVGPSWSREELVGAPTIYRSGAAGAVALSREEFVGRGFTRVLYDAAAFEGYWSWSDMAAALVRLLGREPPPPLVVAYWDELDTIEHLRGPADPSVELEVDRLLAFVEFVARGVGPRLARATTVLVTADHGLVPADPARQVAVDTAPGLVARLARPPTGDRRAAFLKARPGELAALRRDLDQRLPEGARVLTREEALGHGLFGPPPYHAELDERVGDLVVLVPSPSGVTYTLPGRARERRELLGAHGGLEAEELVVPLVAAALEDLGRDASDATPKG